MEKQAKKLIVYSLAGLMLSGIGAAIAQAASPNQDSRTDTLYARRGSDDDERDDRGGRRGRGSSSSGRYHKYGHERYQGSHWRESRGSFDHRQPWAWHSRNHAGRRLIIDAAWDQEFPGLRSYYWNGPGFYYGGVEYRDAVLFYDDGDELVSVGFWDDGQFIMIRDDGRRYYNNNPYVSRFHPFIRLRIRL